MFNFFKKKDTFVKINPIARKKSIQIFKYIKKNDICFNENNGKISFVILETIYTVDSNGYIGTTKSNWTWNEDSTNIDGVFLYELLHVYRQTKDRLFVLESFEKIINPETPKTEVKNEP